MKLIQTINHNDRYTHCHDCEQCKKSETHEFESIELIDPHSMILRWTCIVCNAKNVMIRNIGEGSIDIDGITHTRSKCLPFFDALPKPIDTVRPTKLVEIVEEIMCSTKTPNFTYGGGKTMSLINLRGKGIKCLDCEQMLEGKTMDEIMVEHFKTCPVLNKKEVK